MGVNAKHIYASLILISGTFIYCWKELKVNYASHTEEDVMYFSSPKRVGDGIVETDQ